jgi:adenosylmethionine-8-amino-7-oxononanoate aminotransferase
MHPLAQQDHRYVWHPFTQMRDWLKREPIVIVEGHGAVLRDAQGREYLDANSSIWTNLHGHNHPKINAALKRQLNKIAHSSALGLANEPASLLAGKLVQAANPAPRAAPVPLATGPYRKLAAARTGPALSKVFFSDDGSTAMEVALKLAYEHARRSGPVRKLKFLSLANSYHGDTLGAVALGQIDLFRSAWSSLLFKTDPVMAPYCYRCPFNRAAPERADARLYRKCSWECLDVVEHKFAAQKKKGNPYTAFVFEPLMQGAAGMIAQPAGWLGRATQIARGHGALLIADEVMTGFGRTGVASATTDVAVRGRPRPRGEPILFACHHEGVRPDFLALAKGLTGGYLPMAATLTTENVFESFLGEYDELKTFFHGHSYTANQLGAAAALASLELLRSPATTRARQGLEQTLRDELKTLWAHPNVGDIRQVGTVAGIELVKDWRTRKPFDWRERAGVRVCEAMARRGVLTRPVGNVVVLLPPHCTTPDQARRMVQALRKAIASELE